MGFEVHRYATGNFFRQVHGSIRITKLCGRLTEKSVRHYPSAVRDLNGNCLTAASSRFPVRPSPGAAGGSGRKLLVGHGCPACTLVPFWWRMEQFGTDRYASAK